MSWAKTLGMAGALLKKTVGVDDKTADAEVPLKARVGSGVAFKLTPFLRATNGLVPRPGPVQLVVAISRVRAAMGGSVYRLYTSKGDEEGEAESFVQLHVGSNGEVDERVYFVRLARLYPTTVEEQEAYAGERGEGLGEATFSLSNEQLLGTGLSAGSVAAACGQSGVVMYDRACGNEHERFVKPFTGVENRIDDRDGLRGLSQEVVFMPYRRRLDSGAEEQLLISTEVVRDRDGDAGKREVHVDFMIGLALAEGDLSIQ